MDILDGNGSRAAALDFRWDACFINTHLSSSIHFGLGGGLHTSAAKLRPATSLWRYGVKKSMRRDPIDASLIKESMQISVGCSNFAEHQKFGQDMPGKSVSTSQKTGAMFI